MSGSPHPTAKSYSGSFAEAPAQVQKAVGKLNPSTNVVYAASGKHAAFLHFSQGKTADVVTHVAAGAELEVVIFCDNESSLTLTHRGTVEEGGISLLRIATLGTGDTQHTLRTELTGAGAISTVDWMFHARGTAKHRLEAVNAFLAPRGGGEMTMWGVAEEKAHGSVNGMIAIGLNGGGTDTYLTQDVLMLDPLARVDAVPGLEIKTNDVKASHSASVRRVSPEDLFYFASRGIGTEEARRMFLTGFLATFVDKIAAPDLRQAVGERIAKKYNILDIAQ